MESIWIPALLVFAITILLFWWITRKHFQREYGQKAWQHWGNRTYYWQGAILTGTAFTLLFVLLFKCL